MPTNYEMVKEFHQVFGHPIALIPAFPTEELRKLREDLISEERSELSDAEEKRDIVGVADALSDLLYVIYGMGLVYGIDLDKTFQEVHRSNMSKLGADGKPIYREDGKVLKGPNYTPPDLKKVLGL
jgi:predicted HAD superfamily Cof-like phosphohydrolase